MTDRIIATPKALELIKSVQDRFGSIQFVQDDGCLEGSASHCYRLDELTAGNHIKLLGEIAGVPYYIGPRTFESWKNFQVIIDAEPGMGDDSFSLESHFGCHFVNRWTALNDPACP